MSMPLNSLRIWVALLAPVVLVQAAPRRHANAAGGGYRLSLAALLGKQKLQPYEIFVGAADFDGHGKRSVVAVTPDGRVQVWSWRGNRFVTVYGPTHIPHWKASLSESVFIADIDGDGRDEILRASDNWSYPDQVLRVYKWKNGRFRLKHEGRIILGEDLQEITCVVRVSRTGERYVVLLTHNREDAGQTLRFYSLDSFLKGKSPLDGIAIDTNLFSVAYLGSALIDLDGQGTDELLVSLEAQAADFSRQPSPTVWRLQAYRYSPTTRAFDLQREWRDPPPALRRLFGGIMPGPETLLAGMEGDRLVLCRWNGRTFTTHETTVRVRGEPRVLSDLSGNKRYRVIALEGSSAVWVSDRIIPGHQ